MEQARIRPMRIGEIFDNIFFITRRNFKAMVNLHVILFLPILVLVAIAALVFMLVIRANPFLIQQFQTPGSAAMVGGILLLVVGGIGLFLAIGILMLFNMYGVYRIFQAGLEGKSLSWKESLKGSLRGALYFFVASLVVSTISSVITIPLGILRIISPFFVIPQLIISYGLQIFSLVTFPSMALEGTDPIKAIWRSCTLVWKNFWRTVGIYLLFVLLAIIAYIVAVILCVAPFIAIFSMKGFSMQTPPDWTFFVDPWFIGLALLAMTVLFFLGFIFLMASFGLQVMVLNDLRMRSEGYDILQSVTNEGIVTP